MLCGDSPCVRLPQPSGTVTHAADLVLLRNGDLIVDIQSLLQLA